MLDEQATARAGVFRESFAFVGPRQTFAADGRAFPAGQLQLIAGLHKRSQLRRADRGGADAAALRDAGLVDADGVLTADGELIHSHWRLRKPLLEVRSRGRRAGLLSAWLGVGGTVMIGTSSTPDDVESEILLGMFTMDRALPTILSWIGVRPVWTFGHETSMPTATYEQRAVDAAAPAPEDADDDLHRAWAQPWTEHHIVTPASGIIVVDAGDAGFLRVASRRGVTRVAPIGSRDVYDAVLGLYGTAVSLAG